MILFGERMMSDHIWGSIAQKPPPQENGRKKAILGKNGNIWNPQYLQNYKQDKGQAETNNSTSWVV